MKGMNCCLIDFNNIKKINELLGYTKVNTLIFNIFKEFEKYNCIVGRWFSGDEILIVHKDIDEKIIILKQLAHKHSMSFKEQYIYNKPLKKIEIIVDHINAR